MGVRVDLVADASGYYKVGHIYKDGPADRDHLKIATGNYIIAFDDRDLELSVVGPTFKGSNLKENGFLNSPKGPDFGAGPASCGGTPTVFDSQAPTSIVQGSPPFLGSFAPLTSLDGLRGGRVQGKWTLELLDHFPGNIDGSAGAPGVLNCWKLTIRYKPAQRR